MNEGTMNRFLCLSILTFSLTTTSSSQLGEWKGSLRLPVWSIDPDGEFVTIMYGLSDSLSKTYEVSLQLSNTEQRVLVEPDAVTGHIGTVQAGAVRKIIWHYRKDYPAGLRGRGWKFILTIGWGRTKVTVATREGTFTPPRLRIDNLAFAEPNGNNLLDAGELGEISFTVHNEGLGDAAGTTARLSLLSPMQGIRFDTLLSCTDMPIGGVSRVRATVKGVEGLPTGLAKILLTVQDRFLFSVVHDTITIPTQAFLPPALEVTNRWLQSTMNPGARRMADAPLVIRGDTTTIFLQVKNKGRGRADSLRATVMPDGEGWNVTYTSRSRVLLIRNLAPDSSDLIGFSIVGDERAEADSIQIRVSITERRPAFGIIDTLRLPARRRFLTFDAQFADLMGRQMFDSAAVLCKRQMLIEPHRVSLYSDLGLVYESLGDRSRAVEMYIIASDRGDRNATAWLETNATFKEVTSVRYESMPLPFLDAGASVTIGVFSFPPSTADPSGESLYNTLRASTDRKRIVLVPYRAMISQLGVASLTISDAVTLKRAARDLNITYVIEARDVDKQLQSFTLTIIRTVDGQSAFSRRFQQSVTSTALQDVARLFKDSTVPVYNTKRAFRPKPGRGG
jgi:hypothetical protein